ncbi:hypothetical protein D9757_001559 [Collybiopsis confluens]|uniref:trimethyllysine dioxygenase n=1 Tax=Collybiopsis confluens TaxID=2823264 RepID=A0A8H5HZL0_9AGAR|nr:hypothetical protein D9757_001559 [Collybiopsis confluens]
MLYLRTQVTKAATRSWTCAHHEWFRNGASKFTALRLVYRSLPHTTHRLASSAATRLKVLTSESKSLRPREPQDDLPIISMDERRVAIGWDTRTWSRFHHIWLRDHCRCPSCFHPKTMQRLLNTFEIPSDTQPIKIESTSQGLRVVWPSFASRSTEGSETEAAEDREHESLYPWDWLKSRSYDPRLEKPAEPEEKKILWNSRIAQSPPSISFENVMQPGEEGDKALYRWLQKIDQFGICFVTGVPPTPNATEKLARRIAFIRETQYGQFWEFTANLSKGDTAYTNIALGAHTDNTYFTDPCGLQLFHLLSHTPSSSALADSDSNADPNTPPSTSNLSPTSSISSAFFTRTSSHSPSSSDSPSNSDTFASTSIPPPVSSPPTSPDSFHSTAHPSLGGANLLVDGFYVASILRELHPEAYHILSSVRIPAHAAGEQDTVGVYTTYDKSGGYPVLTHHPHTGELVQVRWNNDDRSVITRFDVGDSPIKQTSSGRDNKDSKTTTPSPPSPPTDAVTAFYNALRTFHSLLTSADSEYRVQLEPGTAVIIDNHRVLHGRSAFTGRRRMCGAYIGGDDFRAKLSWGKGKFGDVRDGQGGEGGEGGRERGVRGKSASVVWSEDF